MLLEVDPTVPFSSFGARRAALGDLLSAIAHELNNPLTAILGYTQLLDSLDADERAGAIATIQSEAQRAAAVIRTLLQELPRSDRSLEPHANLEELIDRAMGAEDVMQEQPLRARLPAHRGW